MRKTLPAAGFCAAAIAVALAGCSTPATRSAPPPRSHASSSAAPSRDPASGTTPSGGPSARYAPRARSVADLGAAVLYQTKQTSSVHMDMTMQVPGTGIVTATGDGRFTGTQAAEQLTMTVPNVGNTHVILVAGTVYLNTPRGLAGTTGRGGKPWVKVTTSGSGASQQAQSLAQTAILAGQADPTHLLQQIEAAGTITKVTQETLSDVATTHYAITVDAAKLAKSDPAERQALNHLGMTSLPFAIWVNSDNLPVRMVTVAPISAPTVATGRQFSITVDYSHWGAPITITAPPTNEVATATG
ncbi:MAG TPA: hypothetical protein VHV49_05505 [Pseudonocardiaceae bacterium]|nr:hypothetical protein [Pseudonocardiaceae bacterium]